VKATVLGAGIIGLWTAHLLQKAGFDVVMVAAQAPMETTSAGAASVLTPFLPWDPNTEIFRKQVGWAKETLEYFQTLPVFDEAAQFLDVYECGSNDLLEDSFHVDKLRYLDFSKFHRIDFARPIDGNDFAIRYQCYICDPSVFLPWLFGELVKQGMEFRTERLLTLKDVETLGTELVFNCLGHSGLFKDPEAYPVFGQSIVIPAPSETGPFFGIGAGDHAVFRHKRGFYIGSYFLHNVSDLIPKQEIYQRSLNFIEDGLPELCRTLNIEPPKINIEHIQRVQTGIRPFRNSGTRIEAEYFGSVLVVHNTGHGAHGWTIGYASAREAVEIAMTSLGHTGVIHSIELASENLPHSSRTDHKSNAEFRTAIHQIDRIQHSEDIEDCARMMSESDPWKALEFSYTQCLESLRQTQIDLHGIRSNDGKLAAFLASMEYGIGSEPMVEYVCVHHNYRGYGLGTDLMRFFEEKLFPHSANMYLFVSDINPKAASLYKRLGYEQVGALPNYNLLKQTEFLFRKTRRPKQV
jgi:D-amino-acid oxidase